LSLGTGD
jgi:hypothetical protein